MAASVQATLGERCFICTSIIITPPSGNNVLWEEAKMMAPQKELLPLDGSTTDSMRKEVVEFISNAGLPITLEPASGMGAAVGVPLLGSSKLFLTLAKLGIQIGKVINRLHRNHQSRQRRLHLPVAHIMLFLDDTTETFVPLVALLPDLQKHLKEKFPSLQIDISIHGSKTELLTEPGMIFDDALVLRIIKRATEDSQQLIAVGQRTFPRFRTILCLNQNVTGLERAQQIRRFFGEELRQ